MPGRVVTKILAAESPHHDRRAAGRVPPTGQASPADRARRFPESPISSARPSAEIRRCTGSARVCSHDIGGRDPGHDPRPCWATQTRQAAELMLWTEAHDRWEAVRGALKPGQIDNMATLEDEHWWFRERRHLIGKAIKESHLPRHSTSVPPRGETPGPGTAGWQSTALEYSAARGRTRTGPWAQGGPGRCPQDPVRIDHFGLVVAFDVLEHIEEDDQVVAEIARVVRPGGLVLIAVPADPRLWSEHDSDVGHVRRYTGRTGRPLRRRPVHHRVGEIVERAAEARRGAPSRRSTGNDLTRLPKVVNAALD